MSIHSLKRGAARVRSAYRKVTTAAALGLMSGWACAASTGEEFDSLYDLLVAWTGGTLGKSIALIFLLVGLGIGVIRGSIIGAITCIAAALSLVVAPDVIASIFGNTTTPGG